MKKILFFLTIILANSSFGQKPDTTYFSEKRNKVATYGEANYFRLTSKLNDTTYSVKEYFTADKSLYMKGVYYDKELTIKNGQFLYYSIEGNFVKEENFRRGKKHGRFYSPTNKRNSFEERTYKSDTLTSRNCVDSNGVKIDCTVVHKFHGFSIAPRYLIGDFGQQLASKIEFTGKECRKMKQIEIEVEFTVTAEGKMDSIAITKSNCEVLNQKILDAIATMGKWKPAVQNGNPVPFRMKVPLSFTK